MSAYSAPIDVFRKAMPLIGAMPPSQIDDQTDEAILANAVYEGIVEDALCRHSWTFATKRATLTYQGETGDSPAYAYALPSDVLKPRSVLLSLTPFRSFEMRGNTLLCDVSSTTDLDLLYNWRAPESSWPSDFGWAIVRLLAAQLARGLLDRATQADNLEMMAERKLNHASVSDRRASGKLYAFNDPDLVKAWRGSVTRRAAVATS